MISTAVMRIYSWARSSHELGLSGASKFAFELVRNFLSQSTAQYKLYSKFSQHPLWVRPKSSDIYVFKQIFIEREYRCLDTIRNPTLIVDCGANVGYSSAYFLGRYRDAKVIAIEPDKDNFSQLLRNTAPYGARITAILAGVWWKKADLVITEHPSEYGKEWAFSVREARPGEQDVVPGVDLNSIWRELGCPGISILKVDIEGSEKVMFDAPDKPWLSAVENIVVELHGHACRSSFLAAIQGEGFEISECGELTVCKRLSETAV